MDNSHDTLIGALNRAAEWFSESCMKAEATYCLSAIEAAKGKRHMDKPVSEPTAPAEPSSALDQLADGPGIFSVTAHELAAMSKDAERYRWLRLNMQHEAINAETGNYDGHGNMKHVPLFDCFLDAAIDAAMKG